MISIDYRTLTIIQLKPEKIFRCQHCETKFYSNEWTKTKKGYSVKCHAALTPFGRSVNKLLT